jgi:hypothetical protein
VAISFFRVGSLGETYRNLQNFSPQIAEYPKKSLPLQLKFRTTTMAHDVFISYSRKDTEVADRICEVFDKVGISYFIDRQGIGGGLEFPLVLAENIVSSKLFLFLASENS